MGEAVLEAGCRSAFSEILGDGRLHLSVQRSEEDVMVTKAGLIIAGVGMGAALTLGIFGFFEVGIPELSAPPDEIAERVRHNFLTAEESYLRWGRWIDLATAFSFAGLLLVVPTLRDSRRAHGSLVAGVTIVVVADMIDLSKIVAIDTGRLALDNDLAADFAAANMARFMLDWTSTYIWVAGLMILAVGLVVLALDADPGRWRTLTGILAFTVAAVAVTDILRTTVPAFEAAFTVMAIALIVWTFHVPRHVFVPGGGT